VDNFIMICAGDAIEASIGVALSLSTMAAAGLGNAFSDVVRSDCLPATQLCASSTKLLASNIKVSRALFLFLGQHGACFFFFFFFFCVIRLGSRRRTALRASSGAWDCPLLG
jgi:hypothetical protein